MMDGSTESTAAPLGAPALAALAELGVITASGEDAARFLHGQLTQDVEHLGSDQLRLAGYCTPKGRLLATFRIWRDDGGIHLLLPREILPAVLKRLSMFVLRAKATLVDASAAWQAQALFGAGAGAALRRAFGAVPARAGDCTVAGALRIARLPASVRVAERFLLLCPAAEAPSLPAPLAGAACVEASVFWWSEIDAGVPTVFAATQEMFVPQMINFEVVGGVDFRKGCYPGQEVVARNQYRGKLKRRMQRAHVDAAVTPAADVFAEGAPEAVGTVAMAAAAPDGGFDLLFECPLESAASTLRAGAPSGPRLAPRELPYEIVDVTA
jgi:folate-binding protein YgfZ